MPRTNNAAALAAAAGMVAGGATQAGTVNANLLERTLYSRLAISNGGLSPNSTTTFRFFQDNFSPYTTNIKQPGKLTQRGGLNVLGMGFKLEFAGDSEFDTDNGAAALVEAHRKYIEQGYILGKLNGEEVIEDYGLDGYPRGGGADGFGLAWGQPASNAIGVGIHLTNGSPIIQNRHFFRFPIDAVGPLDVFELNVSYTSAITLPSGVTGTLTCYLWCEELKPNSRAA